MRKSQLSLIVIVVAVVAAVWGPRALERAGGPAAPVTQNAPQVDARVGFTSARALDEHFEKHGREFGNVTRAQYERLAQELRDAPAGGPVREVVRGDGVITRFDTRSGAFVAFHSDRTIRTFFKPADGLRYFERQAGKEH